MKQIKKLLINICWFMACCMVSFALYSGLRQEITDQEEEDEFESNLGIGS